MIKIIGQFSYISLIHQISPFIGYWFFLNSLYGLIRNEQRKYDISNENK